MYINIYRIKKELAKHINKGKMGKHLKKELLISQIKIDNILEYLSFSKPRKKGYKTLICLNDGTLS